MRRAGPARAGLAFALALIVGTLAATPPTTVAEPVTVNDPVSAVVAAPDLVVIDRGQVTVDAHNADLSDVLSELGARAHFRVKISGSLGRVTTTFTVMSVEHALTRLVQDHELMLVYSAPLDERGHTRLIQADVFASAPSAARVRAATELLGRQRAGLLAEIERLTRSRNSERSAPRLAELLGTAQDSVVRARAASALAALSGPRSQAALTSALGDSASNVRVQAVRGLRVVEGMRAAPALGRVLLTDPDVTVRRAAAQMLGSLQDPAATAALSAGAQDADASVRRAVRRALNRRGGAASP